jgi:two-component system, OmpR family, sensor kinase
MATTTTAAAEPAATAATTTETTEAGSGRRRLTWPPGLPRRPSWLRRWEPASLRTRILAWFIGVLALATVSSVLVTYEVLLNRLDNRIDGDLTQEAAELRALAADNDPATGRPFGTNVRRIFRVYLQRNVPSRNEALITFVNGEPYLRSPYVVPYHLDEDPEIVARWASIRATVRDRVDTPAGPVEYLAVPLRSDEQTRGVFVAAIFVRRARAEADSAVRAAGLVGLLLLALGSVLAWRLADRIVRPVRALTTTARSISETELSARIPLRGRDEVAQLAGTFNEMLDRLETAFASQRRFVDDAGHELKTPLTIVRGHLELLDQDEDPREREATLALVLDELDRMSLIVQDLLLLATHDRPDFLALAPVDVATLSDELYAKAKALAPREWVLEARGRGTIVADRHRLTQAVVQLAQNAARYGGGGRIELGSRVADGEASFWVRDEGPGISADLQGEIFERFRRGGVMPRSEGAGLGLSIVKAIAEAHRGRVQLESRPGVGATFTLVIPVDSRDGRMSS